MRFEKSCSQCWCMFGEPVLVSFCCVGSVYWHSKWSFCLCLLWLIFFRMAQVLILFWCSVFNLWHLSSVYIVVDGRHCYCFFIYVLISCGNGLASGPLLTVALGIGSTSGTLGIITLWTDLWVVTWNACRLLVVIVCAAASASTLPLKYSLSIHRGSCTFAQK